MNYYQHHIGDFNNASMCLTRVERSLYRDLIELYYHKEKPLTSDIRILEKLAMAITKEEKEALSIVLELFFNLEEDGYHNNRCDEEIQKYIEKSEAKKKAGKASAAKRKQMSTGVEQVLNKRSTNQEPITNNQLKEKIQKEKKPRKIFTPPTIDEITAYCQERGGKVDPDRWFDFYQAKGWMLGKNKMKDWKAAVRTWERNSNETNQRSGHRKNADRFDIDLNDTDWDIAPN